MHDHFANQQQKSATNNVTTGCAVTPRHQQQPVELKLPQVKETLVSTRKQTQSTDNRKTDTVLLQTGKVKLSENNKQVTAGVLFDTGSMKSYLRRNIQQQLNLQPHSKQSLYVNGFGGHSTQKTYDIANVDVLTRDGVKTIEVMITDEIVKPIKQDGWAACLEYDYISELDCLANDFSDDQLVVDLLIGCDYAFEFLENKIIKGDFVDFAIDSPYFG